MKNYLNALEMKIDASPSFNRDVVSYASRDLQRDIRSQTIKEELLKILRSISNNKLTREQTIVVLKSIKVSLDSRINKELEITSNPMSLIISLNVHEGLKTVRDRLESDIRLLETDKKTCCGNC